MAGLGSRFMTYGLYHVNRVTGEVRPYSRADAHGLTQAAAEQRAADVRIGEGRGSAHRDNWTTEARPGACV